MEEKKEEEKDDGVIIISPNQSSRHRSHKPSWLLLSVADLDKRMKMVTSSSSTKRENAGSFAVQAETYYEKRPQLLSLLQDLYNGYLILADRYCRTLAKHKHSSSSSSIPVVHFNSDEEVHSSEIEIESDAESSLSFQTPIKAVQVITDVDRVVAELVMKNVEYEIIVDEFYMEESRWKELPRKIELQKSLLEVLESERLILLNENATLGYRVRTLMEENKGLGAESLFMKRKAGELARCVLKLREDYRVCMLSRKIEDLQAQIYGLEKRNKEYYEQLVKQEEEKRSSSTNIARKIMKHKNGEVTLEDCFQVDKDDARGGAMSKRFWWSGGGSGGSGGSGRRVSKLWDKVKNFDMLLCAPNYNST